MYDPIMRVLTVLEILQAREQVSGTELAERLEVSPRTVQRYIARLQDLCVPVEAVRGGKVGAGCTGAGARECTNGRGGRCAGAGAVDD